MICSDYQTDERMAAKLAAIPLPDLRGKSVLDVGCDFGWWSFLAAEHGASYVLGIDRGRFVRPAGETDVVWQCLKEATRRQVLACDFRRVHLGRQWPSLGKFDVIFLFSLYHHIYQSAGGDHEPIWFWLWQQCRPDAVVLWENPLDTTDSVVQANVEPSYHADYTPEKILAAAWRYFTAEYIGKAGHVATREVYRFRPRLEVKRWLDAEMVSGAGGASAAFLYADGQRIAEIECVLGMRPQPGSLNLLCREDFDWRSGYLRAQILDVVARGRGLAGPWATRWARFYPLQVGGVDAWAFRFEGESYPDNFVELIAPVHLRDALAGREVTLCRPRPIS